MQSGWTPICGGGSDKHMNLLESLMGTIPTDEGHEEPCPLSGCHEWTTSLKSHILNDHAPGIFREDIQPTNQVCRERYAALDILAKKLRGTGTTIEGLQTFLNDLHLFSADQPPSVVPQDEQIPLQHLCQVRQWPVPQRFMLAPLNSPAVLTHWRVLAHVLSMMIPSDVEDVCSTFGDPRRLSTEEEGDFIVIDNIEEESEMAVE